MTSEKSQIKFAKSERREGCMLYFPALKTRQLKGVREDSRYGKQICVLAEDLKGTIERPVSAARFLFSWQAFSLFAYPLPSGECEPSFVWRCTFVWCHTSRHTLWVSDCPNRPSPIGYQDAVGGNNRLPIGLIYQCNNYVLPICFRASIPQHSAATEQSPPTPLHHWI